MSVRPRLVCIPSTDDEFGAHVERLLTTLIQDATAADGEPSPDQLQRLLHDRYPGAVVREREPWVAIDVDEVVWYVTNRPYRSRISANLDVPVVLETAFHIYVGRVVEWQNAVQLRPIRLTPDFVGSEYAAQYGLFGRALDGRFRVVEADPPHSVRFEATGMGIRVWYATSFTPAASGAATHVRVVGDYDVPDGILPRIADRLFVERMIQRQIDSAHQALLELCRREAAGRLSA